MKLHLYSNCESYAKLDIKRVLIQLGFDLSLSVQRSSLERRILVGAVRS
jgi:hypothetical protein